VVREYQRLKEAEANSMLGEWDVKRVLSKVNYAIHTDAVRDFVIPQINAEREKTYAYADEADLLNLALWNCTAKQWREANAVYAEKGLNIRDIASINELVVLSNLESFNAELLKRGVDKSNRYKFLYEMATSQIERLDSIDAAKKFRAIDTEKRLNK
jgi:hypothetical protein